MTRIQLACYGLIGTACILMALLVVQIQHSRILPGAYADQVLTRGTMTVMTARTDNTEESLFVLDNISQRLLIYRVTLLGRRGRIDLSDSVPLQQLFAGAPAGGGGAGGRRPR